MHFEVHGFHIVKSDIEAISLIWMSLH